MRVFRVTLEHVDALAQAAVAQHEGRGHVVGEPVPVYTSERAETAELEFRAHLPGDATGTRIRVTPLRFQGLLLDGTDGAVQAAAGISADGLVDERDRSAAQTLCTYARSVGADAVRVPSVRHPGGTNVIVFHDRRSTLTPDSPSFRTL